ncbi:CGNR zinc finger domain-containing protein [Aquipuribacter sp. SD81]|uniref:CGNR zinc finger domain-containing protein n=1 Tax=Aquipuribacter sp. SD81 TaxID=3127703 RepID=UPI0030193CEF
MQLNPYTRAVLALAADLASAPARSPADLAARCAAAGVRLEQPATAEDVTGVQAFLADWLAVVDADEPARRATLLNGLLARSTDHPRLTDHSGDGWHLHFRPDRLGVAAQVAALVSAATAVHLTGRGMHRLGRCDAPGCDHVVVDTTRNGRQRYCGTTCANRDAVRRHRLRQRAAAT